MFSKKFYVLSGRASALALAVALTHGTSALADYPGEVWSVDALVIKNDSSATGLMTKELRAGMQRANETYFFGARPMRMVVEGLPGKKTAMRLTLIEQATGEVIARSAKLEVPDDGAAIQAKALAWMEKLNCASSGCAVAPLEAQPVRVAKARVDSVPKTEQVVSHHGRIIGPDIEQPRSGVPVPLPRPGAETVGGKRGKARIDPAGVAAKELAAAFSSLQIAWAIPREVGALTYTDADTLVLDDAVQLARATPIAPVAAVPVRPVAVPEQPVLEKPGLFARLIDTVADLFTINPQGRSTQVAATRPTATQPAVSATPSPRTVDAEPVKTPDAVAVAPDAAASLVATPTVTETASPAAPAPTIASLIEPPSSRTAWTRATDEITLINPIDRFQRDPNLRGISDGERVAVADIRARLTDPANIRSTQLDAGTIAPRELLRPDPRDSDILLATAQPTRQTTTRLSVKLHPDLLGRYSSSALAGLTPRRNQRLKSASSVGARAPSDESNLNAVLKERGLELNLAGYNRFERLYWGGEGDEGFWISMPNRVNANFVLVSGPTSSVIAAVRRRNGIARVSKGVAEALELQPQEWSKLRIISLRPSDQSAALPFLIWSSVLKGRDVVSQ